MARIRCIKPEFWDDQKMAMISRDARLIYIGLWNQSDDYGVCRADVNFLKNKLFPYEDITKEKFSGWLKELKDFKRIRAFSVNGENYFYLPHFKDHQAITHLSKKRYPFPPRILVKAPENSGNPPENSGSPPENSGSPPENASVEGEGDMEGDMERDMEGEGEKKKQEIKKRIKSLPSPPLPSIPKGLEFKIQDELKKRLAELRFLKRKLEDKEFMKNCPTSYNELLRKFEQKEKKYRELIEDYS
jgi:hypothetical protein